MPGFTKSNSMGIDRRRDHRSQRQGLFDFAALRKAITRRQHDLYFVAFDLLHLNGHDLRDMALEHFCGEEDLRHASLQDFREKT